MSFGLEVKNTSGSVQFSTQNMPFALLSKGTGLSVINPGYPNQQIFVAPVVQQPGDLLFVKAPPNVSVYDERFDDGSSIAHHLLSSSAVSVDWYLFRTKAPATDSWGLRVYNEDSSISYDSSYKLLKIRNAIQFPNAATSDQNMNSFTNISVPNGNYATSILNPRYGSMTWAELVDGVTASTSGAGFDLEFTSIAFFPSGSTEFDNTLTLVQPFPSLCLVIDTTGL